MYIQNALISLVNILEEVLQTFEVTKMDIMV